MISFVEFVFRVRYNRKWYEPIKIDFIRWCSFAYDHPTVRDSFSNMDLSQGAYQAGRKAIKYEPDNPVAQASIALDIIRKKLETILAYLKLTGALLGVTIVWSYSHDHSVVISGISGALLMLVLTPPAIYHVLQHQIQSNTELIRLFNKELVKMDLELWTNRDPRYRTAYFLWNQSLNKPTVHTVLVFLAIVCAVSPRLYGLVCEKLRDNMTEFIDQGILETSKKEMIEIWGQVKSRDNQSSTD